MSPTKLEKAQGIALREALLAEAEERLKTETKRLRQDVKDRKAELEAARNGVLNTELTAPSLAANPTIVQGPTVT
jgi:hypothetical protein